MKKIKSLVLSVVLVTVMSITGCGATNTTTNESTTNPTSAKTQAQTQADTQKAQEKAYVFSVSSGIANCTSSIEKFSSLINPYSVSNDGAIYKSIADASMELSKAASATPPAGYEHAQSLFKQALNSITDQMTNVLIAIKSGDNSKENQSLSALMQTETTIIQGQNEVNTSYKSHAN